MQPASAVAIYILFWALSLFVVLPIGLRTHDELGLEKTEGQADSAPANLSARKILLRTTLVSAVLFGIFYLNYKFEWIQPNDINFFGSPPVAESSGA